MFKCFHTGLSTEIPKHYLLCMTMSPKPLRNLALCFTICYYYDFMNIRTRIDLRILLVVAQVNRSNNKINEHIEFVDYNCLFPLRKPYKRFFFTSSSVA